MSLDTLAHLIVTYRYWILIPLSMLEGPIVAFVAGTLASLGYFNVYALAVFFLIKDMLVDAGYYALGHFGGRTALAQRLLKRIGVTEGHLERVRGLWNKHPATTMLMGKLSYGISASFIVVAGMVRMPLSKFFGWGLFAACVQYGILLFIGYFLGGAFGGQISNILNNLEYVIFGVSIFVAGYFLFTWYMGKRLLKQGENVKKEEA